MRQGLMLMLTLVSWSAAKLKLLWIACGRDDRLLQNAQQLSDLLEKHHIRHEFHTTDGNHSWPVWRRYLAAFAPLLFTERPSSTAASRASRR